MKKKTKRGTVKDTEARIVRLAREFIAKKHLTNAKTRFAGELGTLSLRMIERVDDAAISSWFRWLAITHPWLAVRRTNAH